MKTILILILLGSYLLSNAQLGTYKPDIIKAHGSNYESATAENGNPYIVYHKTRKKVNGDIIKEVEAFYFNQSGLCGETLLMEPSSEADHWIVILNNKFKTIGYRKWRDAENYVTYLLYLSKDNSSVFIRQYYEQ
jgi:hypothetical protein